MDEHIQKQYLEKVPIEIRDAIQSLSTDAVWAVFVAITLEGESYFTELKDRFAANPRQMDRILKKLVDSGLVARKIQKLEDIGDRRKVYYEATRLGRKLLSTLYDIVLPPEVLPPEKPTAIATGTKAGKKTGTNPAFSNDATRLQVSEEANGGRWGDLNTEERK